MTCSTCGETTSSFFIAVGDKLICNTCEKNHEPRKIPQFQRPPIFTRYMCTVHNVGTYNLNYLMMAHIMDDCVLTEKQTLGVVRPATYGGINGDISRKHFLGINQMDRLKTNLSNYNRFANIKMRLNNRRLSYNDRKYFQKHIRFLNTKENPDFTRHNEVLKRLKFNLDVYIQSNRRGNIMSQAERSEVYYKDLMSNFTVKIKQT